jgi:hypothetical protein
MLFNRNRSRSLDARERANVSESSCRSSWVIGRRGGVGLVWRRIFHLSVQKTDFGEPALTVLDFGVTLVGRVPKNQRRLAKVSLLNGDLTGEL